MTTTIGNPLSWITKNVAAAGRGIEYEVEHLGGDRSLDMPVVRQISMADLKHALRRGMEDFGKVRSDVIVACLLYPVIGVGLVWMAIHQQALPLAFPLLFGFALVGPVAALGLYEQSRRLERGEQADWSHMLDVAKSPNLLAIIFLAFALAMLFIFWLLAAWALHSATMGAPNYTGLSDFLTQVFTTPGGWAMLLIGVPMGFVFAAVALAVSVVSFPLLLDRDVGLPRAVVTSMRLMRENPREILAWGAIVVAGLVLGAIPLLLGLAVTLPILGHATWHLYRRAIG